MNVGLFGKIPAQGDFLRIGGGSPVALALDAWLQEGMASLRFPLPATPTGFLFRDAPLTGVLLGMLAPSQDRVGRKFPLVVYVQLELASAGPAFSAVPAAYAHVLMAAAELLAEAPRLDAAGIERRVADLPQVAPDALEGSWHAGARGLEQTPAPTLLGGLFGDLGQRLHHYGVGMFATACARCRGADPGRASIELDCKVASDIELLFWLELSRRMLAWNGVPPSFVWSSASSRLLLSLGAPGPSLLHHLADPSATSDRLWPTRTSDPSLVGGAASSLTDPQRRSLDDPSLNAAGLLTGLAGS